MLIEVLAKQNNCDCVSNIHTFKDSYIEAHIVRNLNNNNM